MSDGMWLCAHGAYNVCSAWRVHKCLWFRMQYIESETCYKIEESEWIKNEVENGKIERTNERTTKTNIRK